MGFMRVIGSSLTTGAPFVGMVADEADPAVHTTVGTQGAESMVADRWERSPGRGMPANHATLKTTIGGSYVVLTGWDPDGDDLDAAVAEMRRILNQGKPLPGVLIVC